MNLTEQLKKTKEASAALRNLDTETKNNVLLRFARLLEENQNTIMTANQEDIGRAQTDGMSPSMLDRLLLNEERIKGIAEGIRQVAGLDDPVGRILREDTLKSGIHLKKVSVPFGVVAIIFEARPNVAADCAALCLKSGNACLLKGGKEAYATSLAIVNCAREALKEYDILPDAITLVDRISHEESARIMQAKEYVDLLIPRGSKKLIQTVVENAKVPVIETGAGVCHVYVDESADIKMAENIVINAKCSRPSVCNSMETLLVNEKAAPAFMPLIIYDLKKHGVIIHGDAMTCQYDSGIVKADENDWYQEYDALEMNCRVVKNVEEAVKHIEKYGTHHSECIVSEDNENVSYFMHHIDSACIYHNASTRFTDGFEFGLGAEIGISTQKLHARGPMGLNELTTYTYYLEGEGEIR